MKSLDREQMVMLLVGIGICCVLTYIVVAPPSTGVLCVSENRCVVMLLSFIWCSLAQDHSYS